MDLQELSVHVPVPLVDYVPGTSPFLVLLRPLPLIDRVDTPVKGAVL